ncbi:hypothetical protein GCM10008090_29130 [Arenicella chitinivorans]|uniref:Uncharacterized protein n=1 Tax=Arenicella chitinivorans TaxID=1329800 RepID=A0A918S038_9GAMM|nr:DUF6151 family protein [Arenicella chitinivorans]GHA17595.1 hypothetical protein GCM10008090_29130 [Arenicella chitinivorans]
MANTLGPQKVPFIGVIGDRLQLSDPEKLETLGPVALKAFGKNAIDNKPVDAHDKFPPAAMLKNP